MFQELIDLLKTEVDTVLYRVAEAESMAGAVREDLSPEIATLEDGVERCTCGLSFASSGARIRAAHRQDSLWIHFVEHAPLCARAAEHGFPFPDLDYGSAR